MPTILLVLSLLLVAAPAHAMEQGPQLQRHRDDVRGRRARAHVRDPADVQSNCMTCDRLAAWPDFATGCQANGVISPDDPIFANATKLDFLWSVTRAQ